jgi:hypothetical protein
MSYTFFNSKLLQVVVVLLVFFATSLFLNPMRSRVASVATRAERVASLLSRVEPAYQEFCKAIILGEPKSFSQAWQDWVIFHHYFSDRLTWADGTYLDIGANDPLWISNTLFFDKCLGWSGLCVEPQLRYHDQIRTHRGCTLFPHCVLGHEQRVSASGEGGGLTLVSSNNASGMTCHSIHKVLKNAHLLDIDLLSIDIEASEPSVLKCFPFDKINVRAVLIETNKHDNKEVDMFFHRHGYSNVETFLNENQWLDNLYVKKEDSLPKPYPSTTFACSEEQRKYNTHSCFPWQTWLKGSQKWGECDEQSTGTLHLS